MDAQARQQHDYQQAATGLVADLKVAGFDIDRLRELRRPGVRDPGAVPILVDWLSRATSVPLKCDIAYVLGSRWARPDGAVALIDEYQRLDDECDGCAARVRAAICTSLERIADDAVLEELCRIALDPRHGSQRGMAIVGLGNMRRSRGRALEVLLALLRDENVALFAVLGLVKLDAREEALRPIALVTGHRNPVVRQVARRAVARWRTPPVAQT